MELTGKCKQDFEKWFIENDKGNPLKSWVSEDLGLIYLQSSWYHLPQSMQYGVYVDFFDSVGIRINVEPFEVLVADKEGFRYWWTMYRGSKILQSNLPLGHLTRQEARIKAIEKANEIYNERN